MFHSVLKGHYTPLKGGDRIGTSSIGDTTHTLLEKAIRQTPSKAMELYLSSLRREYSVDSFEIIDDTARLPSSSFTKPPERAKSLPCDASFSSSNSSLDVDRSLTVQMSQLFSPPPPAYRRRRCRWSGGAKHLEHHPGFYSSPEIKQDCSPTQPIRR